MKYQLYNSLSRKADLAASEQSLDVNDLDINFYEQLKATDEVILYGGDGTINHFINNCITYPKLTIVRAGTGNDFARSLTEQYQTVQIFASNGYKFINGFGTGFDADVCKLANQLPKKTKYSFFKCVYRGLVSAKQQTIEIEVDGNRHQFQRAFLVAIQNGSYFGGGVKIVPSRKLSDEGLQICVISGANKALLATLFPTAFIGLHVKLKKYITILNGKQIKVRLDNPYISQCDGEVSEARCEYMIEKIGEIKVRVNNGKF